MKPTAIFPLLGLSLLLLFSCQPDTGETDTTGTKQPDAPEITGNQENKSRIASPPLASIVRYKTHPGDLEGTLLSEERFDEAGRRVELITYDYYGSGEEDGRSSYTYDDQGNLIQMFDGETTEKMEYDEQNRVVKASWSREGGQGASEERFYDERGNESEVKYYTAEGEFDYSRVYEREYDGQGNILKETKWEKYTDGTADLQMYSIVQEFDNQGQLVVKDMLREDGSTYNQEKYFYDPAGNLIETWEYEGETLMGREVNSVNEYGEVIKDQTFNGMETLQYTNTYEYDEYGHLINMMYRHTDGDAWGERTVYTFAEGS